MSAPMGHESDSQRRSRIVAERKEAERKGGIAACKEKQGKKATEDAIRAARLEAQAIDKARRLTEYTDATEQGETKRLQERDAKIHAEERTRAAEVARRLEEREAKVHAEEMTRAAEVARRLQEREAKVHAEEMTRAAEVANRTAKLEAQAIEKAQKAAVYADARDRGEENMKLEASIKISSKLQHRRDIRAHERALVLRKDVHLVFDLDDLRIFRRMFAHSAEKVRSNVPLILHVARVLDERLSLHRSKFISTSGGPKVENKEWDIWFSIYGHIPWPLLHARGLLPYLVSAFPQDCLMPLLKRKIIPPSVIGPAFMDAALKLDSNEVFDFCVKYNLLDLHSRENLEYILQTPSLHYLLGSKNLINAMPTAWFEDNVMMENIFRITDSFGSWRANILIVAFYNEDLALRYLQQASGPWINFKPTCRFDRRDSDGKLMDDSLSTYINTKELAITFLGKIDPTEFLTDDLSKNREVVLAVVNIHGPRVFRFGKSKQFLNDREVVLASIHSPAEHISGSDCTLRLVRLYCPQLAMDTDIIEASVRRNGLSLKFTPESVRADKKFVLLALSQNSSALEFASSALQSDLEVVRQATSTIPLLLEFASVEIRADKEFVLEVVSKDGSALQFASAALQDDFEVVLTSTSNKPGSLQFASLEMKANKEIVLQAVSLDAAALCYAAPALQIDVDIVETALRQNASEAALYIGKSFRIDLPDDALRFFQLPRVRQTLLKHCSDAIRGDYDLVRLAIGQYSKNIAYASDSLRQDIPLALYAVNLTAYTYHYLPEIMQGKGEIIEAALRVCSKSSLGPLACAYFEESDRVDLIASHLNAVASGTAALVFGQRTFKGNDRLQVQVEVRSIEDVPRSLRQNSVVLKHLLCDGGQSSVSNNAIGLQLAQLLELDRWNQINSDENLMSAILFNMSNDYLRDKAEHITNIDFVCECLQSGDLRFASDSLEGIISMLPARFLSLKKVALTIINIMKDLKKLVAASLFSSFAHDRSFIMEALQLNPDAFLIAHPSLQEDASVIFSGKISKELLILANDNQLLCVRNKRLLCGAIIRTPQRSFSVLSCVPDDLKAQRDVVLAAVASFKTGGDDYCSWNMPQPELQYAPEQFRDDLDIVLPALKSHYGAFKANIKFVSKELKSVFDLAMSAQQPGDLMHISPSMSEYSKFSKLWLERPFSSLWAKMEAKRAVAKYLVRVRKHRNRSSSTPADLKLTTEISALKSEIELDREEDSNSDGSVESD